jgi:hypothetical protein
MSSLTGKTTRAERLVQPLAREVTEQVAADHGMCIRPVSLRRTNIATGAAEMIDVPCGSTLESRCPACAKRKRSLRRSQCEEGWHLEGEPVVETVKKAKKMKRTPPALWWVRYDNSSGKLGAAVSSTGSRTPRGSRPRSSTAFPRARTATFRTRRAPWGR